MLAFLLAIIALIAGAFGGVYYVEKFDKHYKTANEFYIEYKNFDFENVVDNTELQEQLQTYVQQVAELSQELNEANELIEILINNNTGVVTTKTEAFMIIYNEILKIDVDHIVIILRNARNIIVETPETVGFYLIDNLGQYVVRDLFNDFTFALNNYGMNESNLSQIENILLYRYVGFYNGIIDFVNQISNSILSNEMIALSVGNILQFFEFFENYAVL